MVISIIQYELFLTTNKLVKLSNKKIFIFGDIFGK